VQHATLLSEQTWSALQKQAITVNNNNLTTANITADSRKILEHLPLLASRCQIRQLATDLEKVYKSGHSCHERSSRPAHS
jgi:hypothetical protein